MRRAEAIRFVEVADEPLHVQIYADELCRAYRATLAPGQATLYHRHSKDTIYIVTQGGRMATQNLKGQPRCPIVFPRSFSLLKIIRLGLQIAFTGSAYLPAGLSFLMPAGKRPSIHRARASARNPGEVTLIGIELS